MDDRQLSENSDVSASVLAERHDLLGKLERCEGTTEDAEQWIARLKALDSLFTSSDYLLGLERGVRARRILDVLVAETGGGLTREQLVALVGKLLRAEGTAEELDAWLMLVQRNVPDPVVSDLIFRARDQLSAEEIVDRALAYRPITLGPATGER